MAMNPIKNLRGFLHPSLSPDQKSLLKMATGSASASFLLLCHLLISSWSSGNVSASSSALEVRLFQGDGRVTASDAGLRLPFDLFLNESQVKSPISSETSTVSWLKDRLLHDKSIRSVIVRFGEGYSCPGELRNIQLSLERVNRIIGSSGITHKVRHSMALPFACFEELMKGNAGKRMGGIEKSVSKIIVEASVDKYHKRADRLICSVVARTLLAISCLTSDRLQVILLIRGPFAPEEVFQLRQMISESIKTERNKPVEVRFVAEPVSVPSRRELLNPGHDQVFPITPTPTIVTVPGTAGPVAISPTNPTMTPSVFPPIVPVTFPTPPITNPPVTVPPITTTPPVTVPMTPVPVTNPVTTSPSPPGVPTVTPTPFPLTTPPATQSASPTIPGQSWCVANPGASEAALQAALDYACGIGGADCSQIQMGASCYNPNSLQNHASYAFNSYYQRNPATTSCDFSGTATIVATNPSTGSCVYPASSQTSAPATTTTPIPTPAIESLPPPSTGAVPVPGSITPPPVLFPGTPSSGFPTDFGFGGPPPPPGMTGMLSTSTRLQPCVASFLILISAVLQELCGRQRR